MGACCFVSSLHVNAFLLHKLIHVVLVRLFWRRVLNINGEVNFFAKNKQLGYVTVDSCTKVRNAIITCGKCWVQLLWKSSAVLTIIFSKVLFIRSITAFDCGWKDVVRVLSSWRGCMRLWKSLDSKFRPWSVWMLTGTPKRLIQCSSKAVAVVSAIWSGNGTASYNFVKWSPNNALQDLPIESGSGPK